MAENLEKKAPNVRFKGFTYDWELQKFNNVFNSISNNSLSRNDLSYEKGSVINIHYGDLLTKFDEYLDIQNTNLPKIIDDDKATKASRAKLMDGDIIIADTAEDETAGKCVEIGNLTDSVVVSGLHTMAQRPKFEFGKRYLGVYMNSVSYHKQLLPLMQGIKVISISKTAIASTIIVYPQKIEEQNKIGAIFKIISNLLTLYQRKIGLLQQLKKAMLQRLFPDTDTYPKLRFGGFSGPWEQHNLGKVADRFDNLRIPVAESKRISGDIPYYGANGIQDYVKGFTHDGEFLLIAEDGASDLKNYPVNYVNGKVWVNNHAHVISAKNTHADNKFLMNAIKRINFETYIVGGSRSKLNADTMMKLPVKIPKINEQKQIGDFFVKLDTLIALQQRKLDNMNKLKKFMLQQMFI